MKVQVAAISVFLLSLRVISIATEEIEKTLATAQTLSGKMEFTHNRDPRRVPVGISARRPVNSALSLLIMRTSGRRYLTDPDRRTVGFNRRRLFAKPGRISKGVTAHLVGRSVHR